MTPLPAASDEAEDSVSEVRPAGPAGGPLRVVAPQGLEDLIPEYLANRQADLLALAEAISQHEWQTIRVIGHGMKGSGAGYGFPTLSDIGANLENAAVAGNPVLISREIAKMD